MASSRRSSKQFFAVATEASALLHVSVPLNLCWLHVRQQRVSFIFQPLRSLGISINVILNKIKLEKVCHVSACVRACVRACVCVRVSVSVETNMTTAMAMTFKNLIIPSTKTKNNNNNYFSCNLIRGYVRGSVCNAFFLSR